jgi:CRP-like cAMP-binding protein
MKHLTGDNSINEIITHIEGCNEKISIYAAQKQRIDFMDANRAYIYHLISGEIQIHRKNDDIVVLNVKAPALLGFTAINEAKYYHYLTVVSDAKLIAIDKNEIVRILNEFNLWEHAFNIVCKVTQLYHHRDEAMSSSTVYDLVKKYLELLWEYPDEERMKISVFEFIMSRSIISRSSINKVLKDLIGDGYIKMHRGKITFIDKSPQDSQD